ncbi:MAG: hypothetical protein B7Z80_23380 [Rhodospirillales bacterium 20-64-7]|nr:MAG: hypothetical protein B7Z80_23380 [Rhodospirillales bacterium 20-64-7]
MNILFWRTITLAEQFDLWQSRFRAGLVAAGLGSGVKHAQTGCVENAVHAAVLVSLWRSR